MKRIVIIVLCLAATALVATSCSHQSQGPIEAPFSLGDIAGGGSVQQPGDTPTIEPGETPIEPEPEVEPCADLDKDSLCDDEDLDVDGDGIMNSDDDFDTTPSIFVTANASFKMSSVTPTEADSSDFSIFFGDVEEELFKVVLKKIDTSTTSTGTTTETIALQTIAPITLDLLKNSVTLELKGQLFETPCKFCLVTKTDLENATYTFAITRSPDGSSIVEAILSYAGPDYRNNKPKNHREYEASLVYRIDETGERVLEIRDLSMPGIVLIARKDQEDGLLISRRSVTVLDKYHYILSPERDENSGWIEKGVLSSDSSGTVSDYGQEYAVSPKDVSGKRSLLIDGAGTTVSADGSVTTIIQTKGEFRQSQNLALSQERQLLQDAVIFSILETFPLWFVVP